MLASALTVPLQRVVTDNFHLSHTFRIRLQENELSVITQHKVLISMPHSLRAFAPSSLSSSLSFAVKGLCMV